METTVTYSSPKVQVESESEWKLKHTLLVVGFGMVFLSIFLMKR